MIFLSLSSNPWIAYKLWCMEFPEQVKQKMLSEKRLTNRLRLATARLEHARQEYNLQRLAEPEPELSSLSQREQRAILREKMGLSLTHVPQGVKLFRPKNWTA